jgi:hypothetical protein
MYFFLRAYIVRPHCEKTRGRLHGWCSTCSMNEGPTPGIPILRLAARGTVVRVDRQPDGSYGVAIAFKRRRIL